MCGLFQCVDDAIKLAIGFESGCYLPQVDYRKVSKPLELFCCGFRKFDVTNCT